MPLFRLIISLWTILTNKHSFFALLTCFVGLFDLVFFEGFVADTLSKMGLADEHVAYIFAS